MNDKRSPWYCYTANEFDVQPDEIESLSKADLVSILTDIAQAARNVGFLGPIVPREAEPGCLVSFIDAELESKYPADAGNRCGRMFDADELIQGWVSESVSSVHSTGDSTPIDAYTERPFSANGEDTK